MWAWIFLLAVLGLEVGGLAWWLRKEFRPVMFNGWAPLIYSLVLAVDFVATWLMSMIWTPRGSSGTFILVVIGVLLVVVTILFTFFFRWIVTMDINEPRERDRR